MGKLKNLEIEFNPECIPIYAGSVLRGTITFTSRDSVCLRDISVHFEGGSRVHLDSKSKKKMKPDGFSEQIYFKETLSLNDYLGREWSMGHYNTDGSEGNEKMDSLKYRIPSGDHRIKFATPRPLPGDLPSSFAGFYGHVRYKARAVLTTAYGSELGIERRFQVVGREDLSAFHPTAAIPYSLREQFSSRFCCCLLSRARGEALVSVPRTGYVPGETIVIGGEIRNQNGRKPVKKVSVRLIQTVAYRSDASLKDGHEDNVSEKTEQVVKEVHLGQIEPKGVKKFASTATAAKLTIPPLPPSNLRGCAEIDVQYSLCFFLEPGSIRFEIPLIIGTVPYPSSMLNRFSPQRTTNVRPSSPTYRQRNELNQNYSMKESNNEKNGSLGSSLKSKKSFHQSPNNNSPLSVKANSKSSTSTKTNTDYFPSFHPSTGPVPPPFSSHFYHQSGMPPMPPPGGMPPMPPPGGMPPMPPPAGMPRMTPPGMPPMPHPGMFPVYHHPTIPPPHPHNLIPPHFHPFRLPFPFGVSHPPPFQFVHHQHFPSSDRFSRSCNQGNQTQADQGDRPYVSEPTEDRDRPGSQLSKRYEWESGQPQVLKIEEIED